MRVCIVPLLVLVSLISSKEAFSTANHAHLVGIDTADPAQPTTHAQQKVQRFLRRDMVKRKAETETFEETVQKAAKLLGVALVDLEVNNLAKSIENMGVREKAIVKGKAIQKGETSNALAHEAFETLEKAHSKGKAKAKSKDVEENSDNKRMEE